MIAKIFIKNLLIKAKVGVEIHERHTPQDILINIAVWRDVSYAIQSENLNDTTDYSIIQKKIIEIGGKEECVLIETLGNTILEICLEESAVTKAWVRIEKPHKFPESESVGIEMEKSRE